MFTIDQSVIEPTSLIKQKFLIVARCDKFRTWRHAGVFAALIRSMIRKRKNTL